MLEWLMPADLTLATSIFLIIAAGFTSFMTASLGIGGGLLLLALMASTVPVAALIPVHGLVQLGSNGNRALMTRQHIDWNMLKLFSVGAVIGALIASAVVVQLPLSVIQFAVAGFILFLVWGNKPGKADLGSGGRIFAGALTTFLTMFVGATGPLVAGFVHRNNYSKLQLTSTFATCMTLQHSFKAVVFTAVGFAFFEWLPLVILMIASGALGTWVGLKLLNKIPAERFKQIFKVLITVLALRLIWQGIQSF
ncbi:sulfite exporter TauE/SafE family protein [Oceanobacter mangrovi]|uniref:sulfite exporter TauE/SafE family protein n=1 Tax=Oceanobacter mangrovi TaxID=2862510 RepID=UPI001C8E497D|nr:sulfite exporter TauE/SafE family protein [Oceanobacter mangrovi]